MPTPSGRSNPQHNVKHHPMHIELWEKPQNVIILEGFPGLGFVATIVIEYLLDHLEVETIGKIWSPDLQPMALVHKGKVMQPMEIFYNKKYNLVILESFSGVDGLEWEVADALVKLNDLLNAKEVISIEGIGAPPIRKAELTAYYSTNQPAKVKLLEQTGCEPLLEGMIFGVSGALMIKGHDHIKSSYIFAETQAGLPDSRAAAKIIGILDKYIGLDVNPNELMQQAGQMEDKLKVLMKKMKEQQQLKDIKDDDSVEYIG
ncbi:MAG: proteasome assembly chaperone family protein [DPANN group archaeon]|nr:proteasome assembly chaperone family protein [DPANN group archaeon]